MLEQPVLKVDNVSLSFGGVHALRNVSLKVGPAERVGLIGPNGAGKTTLVNCVAGGLTPKTGSVLFNGKSLAGLSAQRRARLGIGRTFQNLELFDSMTALENVMTGLDVLPVHARATTSKAVRAREALAAFELERYANVEVGLLPYGIRKLLELSRAFVRDPRFLLLDEPVAGLSEPESFMETLMEGLDRLRCAVLLVEHDMPTVRQLCDHVVVLDVGAVIASGSFDEVSRDERVVSAYLGADA